jgi:RimJ/RimL family protein N-acetyltransferase
MQPEPGPRSPNLEYRRPLAADALHELIVDDHVKRYLCDGQTLPRAWADDTIAADEQLFRRRGLGLWLLYEPNTGRPLGFCGFVCFPGFDAFAGEPQLVYALRGTATGRGLATEAAAACIRHARACSDLTAIVAAVDEPNRASIRVLEKLGFRRCGERPGAFGAMLLFRLDAA